MIFGLEQEGGSLIAPMALAHPLHPIDNRSRIKRRNLMTLVPVQKLCVNIYIYIYIYMCIPYMSSVIGRIYNGSAIQYWRSCTPSRSIGLYFWGVRGSWAEWHFLFSLVYQFTWYIRSFFGFTFLNILCFFKYSCANIFHRRSLYTFYSTENQPANVHSLHKIEMFYILIGLHHRFWCCTIISIKHIHGIYGCVCVCVCVCCPCVRFLN